MPDSMRSETSSHPRSLSYSCRSPSISPEGWSNPTSLSKIGHSFESEADDYIEMPETGHSRVPFSEPRWARKILQTATSEIALIASCESILELGRLKTDRKHRTLGEFCINFLDHYSWEF